MDPSLAKQLEVIKSLKDPTIQQLSDEYMEKWAKPRKRSWQEDEQLLQKEILPKWGKRKASSIKRREIILLLESIAERGAPIIANRTFALLRRMYNFAIERDILDQTPCLKVKPVAKESQRDRVLNHDEIYELWHKLPESKMSDEIQILVKLMLTTAQRKGELVSANWEHFDFNQRWWTIPADKAKNGKAHRVYLSDMTIDLLVKLKELNPHSEWLFPSPTRSTHMTPDCVSRAIHRSREIYGLKEFSAHDLRRTAASYDCDGYDNEKMDALTQWESKLLSILKKQITSNIIHFRATAKGIVNDSIG